MAVAIHVAPPLRQVLQTVLGATSAEAAKAAEAHKAIRALFAKLGGKLDALFSFHATPKAFKPEVTRVYQWLTNLAWRRTTRRHSPGHPSPLLLPCLRHPFRGHPFEDPPRRVRSAVPAIQMEEATPSAQAVHEGLAPEEVYAAKRANALTTRKASDPTSRTAFAAAVPRRRPHMGIFSKIGEEGEDAPCCMWSLIACTAHGCCRLSVVRGGAVAS